MNKPLLLIVDVQNGFIDKHTKHVPKQIETYIKQERNRFSAVVTTRFINPTGSMFEQLMGWTDLREPDETRLHQLIAPHADHVLTKTTYSNASAVAEIAKQYKTSQIWLCGIDTEVCVLQTASGLWDLGIHPIVLYDLCASTGGKQAHLNAYDILRRTVGTKQLIREQD